MGRCPEAQGRALLCSFTLCGFCAEAGLEGWTAPSQGGPWARLRSGLSLRPVCRHWLSTRAVCVTQEWGGDVRQQVTVRGPAGRQGTRIIVVRDGRGHGDG